MSVKQCVQNPEPRFQTQTIETWQLGAGMFRDLKYIVTCHSRTENFATHGMPKLFIRDNTPQLFSAQV